MFYLSHNISLYLILAGTVSVRATQSVEVWFKLFVCLDRLVFFYISFFIWQHLQFILCSWALFFIILYLYSLLQQFASATCKLWFVTWDYFSCLFWCSTGENTVPVNPVWAPKKPCTDSLKFVFTLRVVATVCNLQPGSSFVKRTPWVATTSTCVDWQTQWQEQEMFNKLQNTHLTSSPGCPMDRPIHQSVGPRESWGGTVKATEMKMSFTSTVLPIPIQSNPIMSLSFLQEQPFWGLASLAHVFGLLHRLVLLPFIPSQALNSTRASFSAVKNSLFLAPCVQEQSNSCCQGWPLA